MTLLLALLGCAGSDLEPATPVMLEPGTPSAGVGEVGLDLPVGSPLGGYSARCDYLGGSGSVDRRDSAYIDTFSPSIGIQTRPAAKALWLENGDQDLVVVKVDLIYSFDELVEAVEDRLEAATGRELDGRVVVTASHSHAAWANFSDQMSYYLGGDKYNEEVFQRLVGSIEAAALAAWSSRQPASIGVGMARDWDPDNQIYSDRRGDNDALAFFDDIPAGSYKDPNLWLLRVDTAGGEPLGVFYSFGMHGTTLGDDNAMASTDSTGGIEAALEEWYDHPVVVAHWQGGAGDASPRGGDREYARLESLGDRAAGLIYDLWAATPTSTDPVALETVTRAIPEELDQIAVTRDGTVDLRYAPFDPDLVPDDLVYDDNGALLSPIDEFNVEFGGAFCGALDMGAFIGDLGTGSTVYPYNTCVDVGVMTDVIRVWFDIPEEEMSLPLPESMRANATAARVGPLPILEPDGTTSTDDVMLAFFPGETTALYTEQFRRRASDELGFAHAFPIGYAQDHEGYLLIPEDWLLGGYEPNINILGPLQGEHIMEGVLQMAADHLLTDLVEPQDPMGIWQPTSYLDRDLPSRAPDETPDAGTAWAADEPLPAELVLPIAVTPEAAPPSEVARVQGIAQLAWMGGDPGVDSPEVRLERQVGGAWEPVTTAAGRPITSDMHDILLVHLPVPISPAEDDQQHLWWASWQVVGHVWDRAAVPDGTYRLAVTGQRYVGGADTWPWPAETYELASDAFSVGPAEISVTGADGTWAAWIAAPAWGYRLIDSEGSSQSANPVRDLTITWVLSDDSTITEAVDGTISGGVTTFTAPPPEDAVVLEVSDAGGNLGRLEL